MNCDLQGGQKPNKNIYYLPRDRDRVVVGDTLRKVRFIMFEDKTLVCKDCGNEFVFTAGEQEFYAERGFTNEPKRCKACRDAKKGATKPEREMFIATCAACGGEAKVPFQPREDRPVYCSACFAKQREEA